MRKILILIALLTGLSNQAEAGKKNIVKTARISGQVFVVTNGRENIKLALVDVVAIREKELTQYLKAQHEKGLEQKKLLLPEVEAAKGEADAAMASKNLAETENLNIRKNPNNRGLSEMMAANKAASEAYDVWLKKNIRYGEIKHKFDFFFDSAEFYFERLPTPLATSKTDADGKFALSLPSGKYALAARSSRATFGNPESYYWLVWIDTSSSNHSIMLSNDNFFETKCTECVKPPMTPL